MGLGNALLQSLCVVVRAAVMAACSVLRDVCKLADFVALADDPHTVDKGKIKDIADCGWG